MNKENIKKGASPKWRSAGLGDLPLIKLLYKKVFSLFKTTQSAEDSPQRHWGMTLCYEQRAFTLIELLVVVLIIGILAAIALPQYAFSVEKARAAEALSMLSSMRQAEEVYYLANGQYTDDFEKLDIEVPESKYWEWKLFPPKAVAAFRKNIDESKEYRFWFRLAHAEPEEVRNTVVCGYDYAEQSEYATRMCRAVGAIASSSEQIGEGAGRFLLNY